MSGAHIVLGCRHCAVTRVKVQKGTTKIVETSSLIRHMYMVEHIIKIHTTRLYNTPIQHANRDIKGTNSS